MATKVSINNDKTINVNVASSKSTSVTIESTKQPLTVGLQTSKGSVVTAYQKAKEHGFEGDIDAWTQYLMSLDDINANEIIMDENPLDFYNAAKNNNN